MENFDMENNDRFWLSLGNALHIDSPKYFRNNEIKTSYDFMLKFQKNKWNNDRVVLFIDEFDALLEAHDDIKSSFLGTIRFIKNSMENYALLSSVIIGLFSILHPNLSKSTTPSLNISCKFISKPKFHTGTSADHI